MKKLLLLFLLSSIIFYTCTPDAKVIQSDATSDLINPAVNQSFTFYKYKDYIPGFMLSDFRLDTIMNGNVASITRTLVTTGLPTNPNNPGISDDKANLGRILFYDKSLSANGEVACASCHHQSKAFTDGLDFSKGLQGESTKRSSMSIQNLAFINNYFWDSRTKSLDELVKQPILNQVEMGNHSMSEVIDRLKTIRYYPELFQNAFGSEGINETSISKALLQFVQSIYSSNSRFDKSAPYNFQNFNSEERLGMELFNGKADCNHCHAAPTFAAPDFEGGSYGENTNFTSLAVSLPDLLKTKAMTEGRTNNGLNATNSPDDMFKIPTLRNITMTAPYMHDGRFQSLTEVIEHYDHGIVMNPSLDRALTTGENNQVKAKRLNLTKQEKSALMAFLNTLTDPDLLTAPRYSNPF
ncbi:MAG: cytochrome c peroxidase [Saprospiraceae bacterium]